jgi:asparagine synthase (glutamine-hydrolysing)
MCGIFSLLNYTDKQTKINNQIIETEFEKGKNRGPENSALFINYPLNIVKGFHRLAINGLNVGSNQPINIENCSLICNGEIYNYKNLYEFINVTPKTRSDCEIIIHLYVKYGIHQTLRMLDGVFAFVLFTQDNIFVARDPYGVRPLYYTDGDIIGFTSELKTICNIANNFNQKVNQFTPGTFMTIDKVIDKETTKVSWVCKDHERYHIPTFSNTTVNTNVNTNKANTFHNDQYKIYLDSINYYLRAAVMKRYMTTQRPIACLLSGGLDSSLIAALVCDIHNKNCNKINKQTNTKIETYSIGLPDSEDIKYARMVASYIGSKHTEIIVSEQDMLDAIPEVIKTIESYDTTTVRASIGNYLIGKYIKEHSEAKVIFNGDGSDELAGGYLYMSSCPDNIEYDKETIRLLKDIHLFDVLRSDKSISSHGLEPRTPFLDRAFVNYYLSIPMEYRNHNFGKNKEKYLIRRAFSPDNLLPVEILWRKKEAFSDGVSNKGKSLFQIIQEHVDKIVTDESLNLKEKEKKYYKDIFEAAYPNQSHLIPYYWMPKYIISDDPSARTLSSYYNG